MNLRIVLLICILKHLSGKSQENYYFNTMDDAIICFPAEVKLWVSDRIEIKDFCSTELFLPNSFTPNDDGYNDTFGAQSVETYSYKLLIFNRNGKIIFETNNLSDRWDGKNAPQGIYVYKIDYNIINRDTGVLHDQQKVGTVTLLR